MSCVGKARLSVVDGVRVTEIAQHESNLIQYVSVKK
jgi:hypothetical protein